MKVTTNSAFQGGGLCISGGQVEVAFSQIAANNGRDNGGGVFVSGESILLVTNSIHILFFLFLLRFSGYWPFFPSILLPELITQ